MQIKCFVWTRIYCERFQKDLDFENNCIRRYRIPKTPDNIEALLNIDINSAPFYFQQALNIDAINNETKCIDRKAHLFWEIPEIDAKIDELMTKLSYSGKAAARLTLNGDNKDSR